MSEECILYGAIIGRSSLTMDPMGENLYSRNVAAIKKLSTVDSYPPLTSNLFTVPQKTKSLDEYYRNQVIHFGASFNNFSGYWRGWLEKFENLLKTMYWIETHLHLKIELYGEYHCIWTASNESILDINTESNPLPVSKWTFEGGPRSFEE